MIELVPSSDLAKKELKRGGFTAKYPWRTMAAGMSFVVPHTEIKFTSLYSLAARNSKKLKKKFRVVDHGPNIGYEVARLDDDLPEMTFTTQIAEAPILPSDSPWKVKE